MAPSFELNGVDPSQKVPFVIGNAFTTSTYGGNPAAIVFLQANQDLPSETLSNIAKNFNQPMTVFVYLPAVPDASNSEIASFRIRWFTTAVEAPMCGHGTLVAAGTIFSTPGLVGENVTTLKFEGTWHTLLARKVEDGQFELTLGAGALEDVAAEKQEKITGVVKKALGDVKVTSILAGSTAPWDELLVVEVEENGTGDLASRKVDCNVFVGGHVFPVAVLVFTYYLALAGIGIR